MCTLVNSSEDGADGENAPALISDLRFPDWESQQSWWIKYNDWMRVNAAKERELKKIVGMPLQRYATAATVILDSGSATLP